MAQSLLLNGFDLSNARVPASAIQRGGPPKDGIPAIDRPRFVAAAQASLSADDRVLGVTVNGDARAYPLRILNWHEVVNDQVGGQPVVVTYCPLCGTGMAFDARVDGRARSFGVSGLLYNSDVLLYDRDTQSLWSQIMRTAVSGPAAGRMLVQLPLAHTTWSDWRTRHPDTRVLSTDTGHVRDYSHDPYAGYESRERLMFDVAHRDHRLEAKAWVLGLQVGAEAKAYPLSALAARLGERGELEDRVGGRRVRIRYDAGHRSAEAVDEQGKPLPSTMAYWFAWVAFFPHTALLSAR